MADEWMNCARCGDLVRYDWRGQCDPCLAEPVETDGEQ